jgi:hypothetical protein
MAPKSLWTIIIKIAGLYIIWQFIVLLPQFFVMLSYIKDRENSQFFVAEFLLLTQGCIYFVTVWGCLFKTDWVIKRLNLENGLDEGTLELNVHRSIVLKIIIIVLGGLLLIDGIPMLFNNALIYWQRKDSFNTFRDNPTTPWIIFSFLKAVIGYCMIAYSRLVVNFIELKRKV